MDLEPHELPDFTTVCSGMRDLKMPVWQGLLERSAKLHDIGEIQAIDAIGMDRIAGSQQYAKRTNYIFKAVKPWRLSTTRLM